MNRSDPNLALLETIAAAPGPLRERFAFVGGCTTGLLVTDVAAAPVRTTHDLEDIITIIDGRPELLDDVRASASQLRDYIGHGVLLRNSEFIQALPAHLAGDETSQARIPLIKDRLRQLSLVA
jgi:hypothetical protein